MPRRLSEENVRVAGEWEFERTTSAPAAALDGVPGAASSKFTVAAVAEIITILLANSNSHNISLLRDLLGGG